MKKLLHLKAILLTLCLSVVGGGMTSATAQTVVFQETFSKCNYEPKDNEGTWNAADGEDKGSSLDNYTDVAGWTGTKVYDGVGNVKMGTSSKAGTLTSPAIGVTGDAVLTFKAHSWKGDTGKLLLSISGGATLSESEFTLNNGADDDWSEFTVNITGMTTSSQLTFTSSKASKGRFYLDDVTITVNTSGKEAAGLSFGEVTKFTADLGSTFTSPTLTKTTDAAATYTSSETSVATVDASTGDVTLVGAGTTTITATTPETDTYAAGSASYTLTVIDLSAMAKFQKVTTITSGKRYLIAVENGGEISVARPVSSDYGWLYVTTPAGTDEAGNLYMENLDNAFTVIATDGGYNIQQADGRYLYQTGTFNNFNVGNEAGSNAVWTIEPQANGTFTITNVAMNKFVQFSIENNSFGSYSDARQDGVLPMLYEEVGGKEAPEFSFAAPTATLNLLDAGAFTAPALNSTSDGAVTYTSSNPEVATIDADGRIEALAAGETTITATLAETDEFTGATAEFTLYVSTLSDYMKTTAVESGKTYALAANVEGTNFMAQTVAATYNYGYLPVNEAGTAALLGATDLLNGFTLTEADGGYTIQDAYGRYLYMDGDHTSFNVSADRQEGDVWTVEPQADGTMKITNVLKGKYIQYSVTHNSYGAYADEQGVMPSLYAKHAIEVGADGYATAYSDNAVILPEGLQAAVITGVVDGKLAIDYRYNSGDVIPAGTAVLVKGEAGDYAYNLATGDEQAVAGNLLCGAASDVTTEGDGCLFYMLSYDANHQNLGFYWAAEDGAAFTSKAGKAYLALPQAASAGVTGYALDGTPVGIDQATTDAQAPAAIYTVDGRLMQQTRTADLPRGLYIVNGKKVIIK